jgi:hypothetical protein
MVRLASQNHEQDFVLTRQKSRDSLNPTQGTPSDKYGKPKKEGMFSGFFGPKKPSPAKRSITFIQDNMMNSVSKTDPSSNYQENQVNKPLPVANLRIEIDDFDI